MEGGLLADFFIKVLKFSELLFILLYLVYVCPSKRSFASHGMISSCGACTSLTRRQQRQRRSRGREATGSIYPGTWSASALGGI